MQAVSVMNVSWVGQAFALARCNDPPPPPAKKSRNRRTKEEWKTMVGSFIKKYQNSNNGNFPSLNLTHNNVGGSFYTVREVFRQVVIQENNVLGPCNLNDSVEKSSRCIDNLSNLSLSVEAHSSTEDGDKGNLQEISASSNQVVSSELVNVIFARRVQDSVDEQMNSEENSRVSKGDSLEVFEAGKLKVGSKPALLVGDVKPEKIHISHGLQAVDTKPEWEEAIMQKQQHNRERRRSIPLLDGMSRKHLKEALKKGEEASESNPITIVASAINGFFASFVEFFTGFKVK